ncbi:MAG: glycosyltransferase [Oligoflexales bacterium]|nr:glycosyltransferase [Oligoflexales bacterium]
MDNAYEALHVGNQHATGHFLVFADADVHYGKTLLKRVVCYMQKGSYDSVCIIPRFIAPSKILQSALSVFMTTMLTICSIGKKTSS